MYELWTSKEIQVTISTKIKSLRLGLNRTQADFAQSIGMSKPTYIRFENTGEGSFENFIRIMQGMGRVSELENILKTADFSPIEAIKNAKKNPPRQRATPIVDNTKNTKTSTKKPSSTFMDKVKEKQELKDKGLKDD